jgi:peroxiredoxin
MPGKPLDYPQLWQCIGMIVGVYGIGYACAALHPIRHWPIVLVGLLGKIFGPIGYVYGVAVGQTRPDAIATIAFNDLIWWVPFFLILRRAYRVHFDEEQFPPRAPLSAAMATATDAFGVSLAELSRRSPVLVVFLRHFGCTYCREAAADVAANREVIEADGTRVVFVHLETPEEADRFFARYGLDTVSRIADPDANLYRAFGLTRGSPGRLFGLKSVARFLPAGVFARHGVGFPTTDGTRMGGVFLIRDTTVVREFRHASPADRPDYIRLAATR